MKNINKQQWQHQERVFSKQCTLVTSVDGQCCSACTKIKENDLRNKGERPSDNAGQNAMTGT